MSARPSFWQTLSRTDSQNISIIIQILILKTSPFFTPTWIAAPGQGSDVLPDAGNGFHPK